MNNQTSTTTRSRTALILAVVAPMLLVLGRPASLAAQSGSPSSFTLKGHKRFVKSVAFSPDGKRIVSGSWDVTLKVWDASTGRQLRTLKGHAAIVTSVAFSPDGKRIVSGSYDNTLKVWDASTGQEIRTLKGHTRLVVSVAFSPEVLLKKIRGQGHSAPRLAK